MRGRTDASGGQWPRRALALAVGLCLAGTLLFGAAAPVLAQEGDGTDERLKRLEEQVREQQRLLEEQQKEIRALRDERERRAAEGGAAEPGGAPPDGKTLEQRVDERVDRRLEEKKKPTDVEAGYKDGFFLRTRDKKFEARLTGYIQADARFVEPDSPIDHNFLVRRGRLATTGRLFEYFTYKLEGNFVTTGSPRLEDGWVNFGFTPAAELRGGQFKQPFALEELTSSRYVNFVERSVATRSIAPSRDQGFMVHGKPFGDVFGYQVGVFNGSGQNTSDGNDDKDVALRLVLDPFAKSENEWTEGLHVGGAFTYGHQEKDFSGVDLETAIGTDWFEFADDVEHEGSRCRWGVEAAWLVGPASIRAEYMQERRSGMELGTESEGYRADGWYVTLTYLLTGEEASMTRVDVESEMDPFADEVGFGAWEVAARIAQLDVNSSLISDGLAEGTDRVEELTVGINWYLNRMTTVRFDYVRTWFDDEILIDDRERNDEDAFLARLQVEF